MQEVLEKMERDLQITPADFGQRNVEEQDRRPGLGPPPHTRQAYRIILGTSVETESDCVNATLGVQSQGVQQRMEGVGKLHQDAQTAGR